MQNSSGCFDFFYTYSDSSCRADHEYHFFNLQNLSLHESWRKTLNTAKVSKTEKIDIYHKTDFFGVVAQAKGFKVIFSESALKTVLENGFQFILLVNSRPPMSVQADWC